MIERIPSSRPPSANDNDSDERRSRMHAVIESQQYSEEQLQQSKELVANMSADSLRTLFSQSSEKDWAIHPTLFAALLERL